VVEEAAAETTVDTAVTDYQKIVTPKPFKKPQSPTTNVNQVRVFF
jgi:hypothetical protein